MNRIELIKRWLLAQIQPELFYIPWNNNATKYNVYIYSHIYDINENHPDIESCKEQGIRPFTDYGFLIFNSKGEIVSYNSFCIPLPKGKYCAIHWTSFTYDKVSYSRKYVFFEVKDSDVYIFVEETTRSYIFEVHYEEKTYTETYVRNYVLQQYPPYGTRYLDLFEYNGREVENTSLSPETIDSNKIPYHQLISNSYVGVNRYAKNSVKEYNTIEKYREITTENKNGYRIYFSIKEKNNNFNCERYDINLTTVSKYNQKIIERWYDLNPDEGYIYDYRNIAADRTWTIRDGLYTNKKGNIVAKKNNFDDRYYVRFGDTDLYLTAYHCFDWNYNSAILRTHRFNGHIDIGYYDYVKNYNFFKSPLKEWLPEIIDDTWVGDEFHFNNGTAEIFDNPIGNSDEYKYQTYSNKYDTHLVVPEETINELINNSIALFDSALPDDETTPPYFNPEIMDYTYIDEDGLTLREYCQGMHGLYENANVTLNRNLFILGKDFNKYGYSLNPNGIYTLNNSWIIMPCYSQIGHSDEYKKTYCVIHYTPVVDYYRYNPQTQKSERVLMILTPKEVTEYFKNLITTQDKFLQDSKFYTYTTLDVDYVDDKNVVHYGNRIIINYKEIDITDDEYQEYQSQTDYSDKMEQIISEQNRMKNHISHLQKEFIQRYKEEYKEIPITSIPER